MALATTPAGVSGAFLLVPIQVGILGVANPAVTPTNLLYNLIAIPGSLAGYRGAGQSGARLVRALVAGSVPGVVVGAILRVEVFDDPRTFDVIIALVLVALGFWLMAPSSGRLADHGHRLTDVTTASLAFVVGVVGGIYGIGGGSLLAPILVGTGLSVRLVAPAALTATFVASASGVAAFAVLASSSSATSIGPEWELGVALGLGGMAGGFAGARLQPRLPEAAIKRALGLIALAIAARFAIQAV